MQADIKSFCVLKNASVRNVITAIERGHVGIALIVDSCRRLLNTVTDGDIRRSILGGITLDSVVTDLLAYKAKAFPSKPVTAPLGATKDILLNLMRQKFVRQIPLLNRKGQVVKLVTMDALLPSNELPLQAVIMAGGFGKRLRPLTEDLPKPMLRVGNRPVMEHIIGQLQQAGIRRVNVTTHYKHEKITEHFGNGEAFGVELNYVKEDKPLGTGGALGLIPKPNEPILVINGDILTQVDFKAMLAYHREYRAEMTVAVRIYDMQVPYGVIEMKGHQVAGVKEKPQLRFFVNAGIYLLQPSVFKFIPRRQHFNMTDLIQKLVQKKETVASFPVHEYWLDIGRHADYLQAQKDASLILSK